jgi:TDG/mug DNA glycosylase family protein
MIKSGFPPVIDHDTETLILGSLPSDISIRTGEYYANPQNQFWRIIFTIFNKSIPFYQYSDKTNLLLNHKIGLWDVLTEAHRQGSLDSNIRGEVLNNFSDLFKAYPSIRKLAFNGDKAFQIYLRNNSGLPQKNMVLLTSSSSANTRKTLLQKVKDWEMVLK